MAYVFSQLIKMNYRYRLPDIFFLLCGYPDKKYIFCQGDLGYNIVVEVLAELVNYSEKYSTS